jgi:hypothetical protein
MKEHSIEQLLIELENIIDLTDNPLYNSLEVGFRHSPLSPKEQIDRLKDVCAHVNICARAALGWER